MKAVVKNGLSTPSTRPVSIAVPRESLTFLTKTIGVRMSLVLLMVLLSFSDFLFRGFLLAVSLQGVSLKGP